MQPVTVYQTLHDAGLHIRIEGDRLVIGPAELLTDDLRQLIRDHKPGLLDLLACASQTAAELIAAIRATCERFGYLDGDQMIAEGLALPLHHQIDLRDHFRSAP